MLVGRIARGGEIVLAGFYGETVRFGFASAFVREARLRIAAEFTPADLAATLSLIADGRLSLRGLVSHARPADELGRAYGEAFDSPECLKMILDWKVAA